MISKLFFFMKVGQWPMEDEMKRVNCRHAGELGHRSCGWCEKHDKPRFVCGCRKPPYPFTERKVRRTVCLN